MFWRDIQPDIDVQTELVALVPPRKRPASRPRNILDVEVAEAGRMCLFPERLDSRNGGGCAPERAAGEVNGLEPNTFRRKLHGTREAARCLTADDMQGSGGWPLGRGRQTQGG